MSRMTRRLYLTTRVMESMSDDIHPVAKYLLAAEAVASTAIEQGWDLDEERTQAEWEKIDG